MKNNFEKSFLCQIDKFVRLLLTSALLISCDSSANETDSIDGVFQIDEMISQSSSIIIFHIDITDGGHQARTPSEVNEMANITLTLNCEYGCGKRYQTINNAFVKNSFYKADCGSPYSTILRLKNNETYEDILIGSEGHCLNFRGETYVVTSSVLSGLLGGFPDYLIVSKEYGLSSEAVIDGFKLNPKLKVDIK